MSSPAPKPRPGLLRSIGQFFGHIAQGVKADVGNEGSEHAGQSVVVRHDVDEEHRDTPTGVVRVRRTVIEEVSLEPGSSVDQPDDGRGVAPDSPSRPIDPTP